MMAIFFPATQRSKMMLAMFIPATQRPKMVLLYIQNLVMADNFS